MASYEKSIDGQYWRREDGFGIFRANYDQWLTEVEFDVEHRCWIAYFSWDGAYIGELSISREYDIPVFYTDDQKIESVLRRAMTVFHAIRELWSHLDD